MGSGDTNSVEAFQELKSSARLWDWAALQEAEKCVLLDNLGLPPDLVAESKENNDEYLLLLTAPAENNYNDSWNSNFVTIFSRDDLQDATLFAENTSRYARLIGAAVKARLLLILCRYETNPEDLAYATLILKKIIEHFESAIRLDSVPLDYIVTLQTRFLDQVEGYFGPPHEQTAVDPVERYHVGAIHLNSVDPFNFVKKDIWEAAIGVWETDSSQIGHLTIEVQQKAQREIEYRWSKFIYDHYLASSPGVPVSEDGDLPLELQYLLPSLFEQKAECEFLEALVGHGDFNGPLPPRTQQIITEFKTGLQEIYSFLNDVYYPPQDQLLGNSSPDQGFEKIIPDINTEETLARVPTGDMLLDWGG